MISLFVIYIINTTAVLFVSDKGILRTRSVSSSEVNDGDMFTRVNIPPVYYLLASGMIPDASR